MDSERESQKLSMGTEDRISRLPDMTLVNVLYYLPTKQAVATSVLSKRWRSLWALVPRLDFDDSLFLHPQDGDANPVETTVSFMNFVNRVLILRTYIPEFKLKCTRYDSFHVNAWILAALRCHVQELDICITPKPSFKLSYDVFAFQELVYIKLGRTFVLDVPKSVCLPKLEVLCLDSIEFRDDDSICKLISSCPVLEELSVENCGFKNIRVFCVSAPKLKTLIISCSISKKDDYSTRNCVFEIVVDAPALETLFYSDFVARGYSLGTLQCLHHVGFDVLYRQEGKDICNKRLLDLLFGVANSESLALSGFSVMAFSLLKKYFFLPKFNYLTRLLLEVNEYCGPLLTIFLENSPNLEILILDTKEVWRDTELKWEPPSHVPKCLLLHLKEVVLNGCSEQEDVIKLINYLQENAKVLNKVSRLPMSPGS
ncbi:hypothetical protein L1049_000918 [Liquidambar formosana]|uniref:F-box domain-containing protein n=1 Tax=Liquidambar formosana TaxID=63359 RepID=A0AAP0NDP5_LIQFO